MKKNNNKTNPHKTHLHGVFTNPFYTVMRVDLQTNIRTMLY